MGNRADNMERAKLDEKDRLTIPASYREKLGLSEEVALILEEDYLIVCKTVTADEFKMASRRRHDLNLHLRRHGSEAQKCLFVARGEGRGRDHRPRLHACMHA